jgi:glutathione synthase/RimK-type ligase-like ATP-grasp enzyme
LSSPARIAFVTYRDLPDLNADDRLAASALEALGLQVDAVCWDDFGADWLAYAAVVVRTTWDYHHRVAEFHAWIDRLEGLGARLWNPPSVLRWNTDKRYLARAWPPRLSPPPTAILDRGSAVDLRALLDARGWGEAVIKPAISADGYSTERTSRDRAASDQAALDTMLARGDVVLQALVPEIRTSGELSLMFFGGVFSHAVSKKPKAGEFRVQERLGGTITRTDPPPMLIEDARDLLEASAPGCLYARVDAVAAGGRFILMEVELVEPTLYLAHDASAAGAFARAIAHIA